MGDLHSLLCPIASRWLRQQGCTATTAENLRAITEFGEQPDALGWRSGVSILVECKATRADFHADKKKPFRLDPLKGMGDWRFYLCPEGLIEPGEIPDGWGLLYERHRKVIPVHGVPVGNGQWGAPPLSGNKHAETAYLVSILRRLKQ